MVSKLKGWRTILWNVFDGLLTIVVGVSVVLEAFQWDQFFEPKTAMILVLAFKLIGTIGNIVLRFITTTPIGKSDA